MVLGTSQCLHSALARWCNQNYAMYFSKCRANYYSNAQEIITNESIKTIQLKVSDMIPSALFFFQNSTWNLACRDFKFFWVKKTIWLKYATAGICTIAFILANRSIKIIS